MSAPGREACPASPWTDLVGCVPNGSHHCENELPEHTWHRCACGAALGPVSTARLVTHVPELPPVPPADCARILGQLPPLSAATVDALDALVRALPSLEATR